MKEKDLPIDRTRHAVYTKKAKKCVLRLLHRDYDDRTCEQLWEKIQLQYCEFLRDEPPMAGAKIKVSIYDPILIFAWYKVVPVKPQLEEVQQDIFDCFMGSFDALGKVFNLNRRLDNLLASRIFRKANDIRAEEIRRFPGSFRMGACSYDKENGVIRYSFTQCPNAEFAKRHHMEDVLPVMCNCDHLAMQKLHACLIREGTCVESTCCDYCIVGDRHPIAQAYELLRKENGLLVSVRKQASGIREEDRSSYRICYTPHSRTRRPHFLSIVRKVLSFFEQGADYEVLGRS
ncbi:MAG: L-2-amino-thiazoline-4-carboxylic acid hydrolase [Clostridia bacterium]|nr:L-2-amino-thiazoline-4-carboxylic acid hydrolase [Clostridia bacterium]